MMHFVSGGAASGKSEYAESLIVKEHSRLGEVVPLLYLATLDASSGGDTLQRIEKHRAMRSGKGFRTVELVFDRGSFFLRFADTGEQESFDAFFARALSRGEFYDVLLEDTGNLVSNVLFAADSPTEATADAVTEKLLMSFIDNLSKVSRLLVVVHNEITLEPLQEEPLMLSYCKILGRIAAHAASRADSAAQVIAGIPVSLK